MRICWRFVLARLQILIILRARCTFEVACYSYVLQQCSGVGFLFFSSPRGLCNKLGEPTVAGRTFEPLRKQNVLNCQKRGKQVDDVSCHPQSGKLHFFGLPKEKKGIRETVPALNIASPAVDQGTEAP